MFIKSQFNKAFTLVELIISIILLGLIVTFLYTAVGDLQKSNSIFSEREKTEGKKEQIINLIYDDIFGAYDLNISGLKQSKIDMTTSNSLFDISHPYVSWLVSKDENRLLRVESTKKFKNVSVNDINLYHIMQIEKDCEVFKIYQSNKKNLILIHIKFKDKEPIIYEFFKPL